MAVGYSVAKFSLGIASGRDRNGVCGDSAVFERLTGTHLVSFAVLALACHGELYRCRPERQLLTEFYLRVSFGGLIGGIFAGLVAPHLFNGIAEYPILVLAALLAMPATLTGGPGRFLSRVAPVWC